MTRPTATDLDAVAHLVARIRPDWDRPGIAAQLAKLVDRPLEAITVAAVYAAATRPDQKTPAVIAATGSHWRDFPRHEPTEQPPRYVPEPNHATADPHRYAAAARANIRSTNLKMEIPA